MQTPKIPRWSDEEAVAKFVNEEIDERKSEADYQAAMDEAYYADRLPPMRRSEIARGMAAGRAAEERGAGTTSSIYQQKKFLVRRPLPPAARRYPKPPP
jgi:hypothetical protein